MRNTLVSIIVPCYNQAQYLVECLESVLNQTYTNWECIIVNDGSSDNTEEIAKYWVAKDNRFKYYYKKNGGVSSTRNLGILNSSGEYILPLDADDRIGDNYIRLAINEFQIDDSLCLVYANASFFGIRNEFWHLPVFDFKNFLLSNCIYCSALFKREDFLRVGGYDEKFKHGNEDWEFWISLLSKYNSPSVKKIDYLGFFYRRKLISRDVELCNDSLKREETLFEIYKKHNLLYEKYFGGYIENVIDSKRLKANIKTLLNSEKLIFNLFTEKFFRFKLFKTKDINF